VREGRSNHRLSSCPEGVFPSLSHKTEKGLVRVDVRSKQEAILAFKELTSRMEGNGKDILVQEMIRGTRELVAGMTETSVRPCVMFGLGGIFTEILRDIAFRVAPLEKRDALDMTQEIKAHKSSEPCAACLRPTWTSSVISS